MMEETYRCRDKLRESQIAESEVSVLVSDMYVGGGYEP